MKEKAIAWYVYGDNKETKRGFLDLNELLRAFNYEDINTCDGWLFATEEEVDAHIETYMEDNQ